MGVVPRGDEGVETGAVVEVEVESVGEVTFGEGWTGTAGKSAIVMIPHKVVLLFCLVQSLLLFKLVGNIALGLS